MLAFIARNLFLPEIFVYISIGIFTGAFFVLNLFTKDLNAGEVFSHYIRLNGDKLVWPAFILLVAAYIRLLVFWIWAGFKGLDPAAFFSRDSMLRAIRALGELLKNALFVGIPFLFAFYTFGLALGQLNLFNAARLQDGLLLQWDVFLTRTFPPLSLASLRYPEWFVKAVDVSFLYLPSALAVFGAYLFQARHKLFREAAGAFFLSAVVMFAFWIVFPVMSPHDRFIDNVYRLPTPASAQSYVDAYHPQEEIASFLQRMREDKKGLSVFPTSTFPSAHVVWAVFLMYYSWRVSRWLVFISVPFALFSSVGTVLFAQHYFVDVPAGILVSAFSIWIVRWMTRKQ